MCGKILRKRFQKVAQGSLAQVTKRSQPKAIYLSEVKRILAPHRKKRGAGSPKIYGWSGPPRAGKYPISRDRPG